MRLVRIVCGLMIMVTAVCLPGRQHAQAAGFTKLVFKGAGAQPHVLPSSTTSTVASATAATKSGPVTVTATNDGVSHTVNLIVSTAKQTFIFELPRSDFTQSGNSATLNTHGDLKGFGSIQITWTQKSTTAPKGSCNVATPGINLVYYSNPKGKAQLKLPCAGTLSATFNGPYNGSNGFLFVPGAGYYSGFQASASLSLSSSASVSLQAYKGSAATQKPQLLAYVSKAVSGSAPLIRQSQQLHATLTAAGALQFDSALNSASLNLTSGPSPFTKTNLTWTATAAAVVPGKDPCVATAPTGGARTASVSGTFALKSCILTGSFAIKSSATTVGQLYSSTLKPQAKPALKLVSSAPTSGQTGVPTTVSAISVTLSNPLNTQAEFGLLQGATSTDIQGLNNPTFSNSNKTATFPLEAPLQPNTMYSVTVNVQDVYQQSLQAKYQFKTGS